MEIRRFVLLPIKHLKILETQKESQRIKEAYPWQQIATDLTISRLIVPGEEQETSLKSLNMLIQIFRIAQILWLAKVEISTENIT
jgi:hypothetical protein